MQSACDLQKMRRGSKQVRQAESRCNQSECARSDIAATELHLYYSFGQNEIHDEFGETNFGWEVWRGAPT